MVYGWRDGCATRKPRLFAALRCGRQRVMTGFTSKFIADPVAGYSGDHREAATRTSYLLEKVPDFYERLKNSYDETFYQQEVLGQYLSLQGGLVYSAFNRARPCEKPARSNPNCPLLWALDFNVDPMSSVVAQIEGRTVFVLDEIALRHASTHEACEEFEKRFPNHMSGIVIYGDASGTASTPQALRTIRLCASTSG